MTTSTADAERRIERTAPTASEMPRGTDCDVAPADEIVTMQFKAEGRPAFSLLTSKGPCSIDAIVAAPRAEPDAAPAQ